MGILGKLFRVTPKEELNGIKIDLNEPFWELEGKTDFTYLLRALPEILPENSILYFEGGSPSGPLLDFLNTQSIPEQTHVAVGTLWPRPDYYHVPATKQNITTLADITERIAEPELAIHFHVYSSGEIILEWHDAFTQPMLLTGKLTRDKVQAFSDKLRMKITKWKNASEQENQPDAE
ncbi:MAG: hypothetical protein HY755_08950 [Nitrospirae bacterium]|nr:hypothetical protein [Nitrospirota bacterium]